MNRRPFSVHTVCMAVPVSHYGSATCVYGSVYILPFGRERSAAMCRIGGIGCRGFLVFGSIPCRSRLTSWRSAWRYRCLKNGAPHRNNALGGRFTRRAVSAFSFSRWGICHVSGSCSGPAAGSVRVAPSPFSPPPPFPTGSRLP